MDLKWDYVLKPHQKACPIIHYEIIELDPEIREPTDEELLTVFKTDAFNLQTWKRSTDENGKTVLLDDPHWIAVRGETPLHIDPKYPRYSHQLKIRVDPGVYCRGLNKEEAEIKRGVFYILDTHSPHQIINKQGRAWNVAASIDYKSVLSREYVLQKLLAFARRGDFSL